MRTFMYDVDIRMACFFFRDPQRKIVDIIGSLSPHGRATPLPGSQIWQEPLESRYITKKYLNIRNETTENNVHSDLCGIQVLYYEVNVTKKACY